MFLQNVKKFRTFTNGHAGVGVGEFTIVFALNELPMKEVIIGFPMVSTSALGSKPFAEMSGDGIEVGAESISSESRYTAMSEAQFEVMH